MFCRPGGRINPGSADPGGPFQACAIGACHCRFCHHAVAFPGHEQRGGIHPDDGAHGPDGSAPATCFERLFQPFVLDPGVCPLLRLRHGSHRPGAKAFLLYPIAISREPIGDSRRLFSDRIGAGTRNPVYDRAYRYNGADRMGAGAIARNSPREAEAPL